MSGDILGCHNLGMDGGSAAGLRWIEARDAINIAWDVHILKKNLLVIWNSNLTGNAVFEFAKHRTALHNEGLSGPKRE